MMIIRTALEPEVISNGRVVWVNGSDGCCIGRFSRAGIDVHYDAASQLNLGVQCLDCKPGPTTLADWRQFQAAMYRYYRAVVSDDHQPKFLEGA